MKHVDLQHGTHILGDAAAAKKILKMFIEKLPEYVAEINLLRDKNAWLELHEAIHALKGASGYSSTPLLNQTVSELNHMLEHVDQKPLSEKEIQHVDQLLFELRQESSMVLQEATLE